MIPIKPARPAKPQTPAEALREARERLAKVKTYENAVEVQRAERQLRDWRKLNIKEVGPDYQTPETTGEKLVRQLKEIGQ
jgi:hypothetical protein